MRPTILHVGGVLYWTIQTRNPDTQVLKDADSTPSVAVRKNGSSVADSVTITKRSATTGLYDCSYNPASEVEGDTFQFEESATVTGTTTSSATYTNQFSVRAVHAGAVELDSASVTAVQSGLATSASITTLRGADNDTLKTLSDQIDTIRDSVGTYIAGISAVASTTTGTIVGFPSSLNIGDSYTEEANSDIRVFIRDENDDPITAVGDFNFTDPEFAPEVNITQSGSTGRVKAVVTFVDASPEDYLKVEIPSSQSRRASPGTATIQCLLKWVDTEGKVLAQKTLTKQAVTWNEMI